MTLHAVTVPTWGLAMEEGKLAGWLVAEGAPVALGDEIAEIETSKIANVLETPAAGVLVRQVARVGEVRPVGTLIGVIADGAEDEVAIDAFIAGYAAQAVSEEKSAPPEPITAPVEGEPFRYLRLAPPEGAPSARPVVLIHGFGGDHTNWLLNQAVLAADRPVYAIDLPGHGGTTKHVGEGSLAALAARVAAWLATIGRGRVHLIGHSMGAAVAATLALNHPDTAKSLTAINGVGFGGALNREYIHGFLAAERRKDLKPVVELLFADPALVTRDLLEGLVAARRIDGAADALRTLAAVALDSVSIDRLAGRTASLAMPVMRVVSDADRIVVGSPRENAVLLSGGHMPHFENASACNRVLSQFLREED